MGMRVALVIYGSLDTVSGGYLYDRKLIEQLRARGHDVVIVSRPWRNYAHHLADNFSPAWRGELYNLDVDLILEDELNHPSLVFAPRPTRQDGTHPPIVTIVHHLRVSEAHPVLLRPVYQALEAHYLRRADAFIFNSKTTCQSVEAIRATLPPHIVAYPAGDHVLTSDSMSLHEAERGADAPLHVAFVGNLIPRKGLHTVIAALALTEAPIELSIAGNDSADPQYTTRLRTQVESAALGDRVHFLGPLSDAERAHLYARSDLLALPSYEGFGIVYLEAMALGRPVIASTAGAAREIVNAGDNGFLVAPDDAETLARYLTALARDPDLLAQMSAAAHVRYTEFPTWDQSTTRIAEFLEELAA